MACIADFVAAKGQSNQADAIAQTLRQARMLRTSLHTALAFGSLASSARASR